MYIFKRDYQVNDATLEEIWEAFTNEDAFEAWNGENAQIDDEVGRKLRMEFDGVRVWGENITTRRPEFLSQQWEFIDEDWKFKSMVTLRFSEFSSGVYVQVLHEDVPDERKDEVEELWREKIIGKLQTYFRNKEKK